MFVLMQLSGFPISAKLPEDLGLGERFWYWRGASGRNYIHSIYPVDACPPLAGAVYVAVKRAGSSRLPVALGRFPTCWDVSRKDLTGLAGADELHVHLLARDEAACGAVLDDLRVAARAPECKSAKPALSAV